MSKHGILHDYDLMANAEPAARGNVCVVCDADPIHYQWSDYSGEAMCTRCGAPYQLKWGTAEQEAGGAYPYLNLREEWVPVVREYFAETGRWAYLGTGFVRPGLLELMNWAGKRYPEMFEGGES